MFFKTEVECSELAKFLGFSMEALREKQVADVVCPGSVRLFIEEPRPASYTVAKQLVSWMGSPRNYLMWVTDYGIWPSSENRHLYYRLRVSYGDSREISQAPGHYFSDDEKTDLVTFVDIAIQFGWGAYLLSDPNSTSIFLSHDGWARVEPEPELAREKIVKDTEALSLSYEIEGV